MEVGDRIIVSKDMWNKGLEGKHGCPYRYGWNVEKENVIPEKVSIKGLLVKRGEDSS